MDHGRWSWVFSILAASTMVWAGETDVFEAIEAVCRNDLVDRSGIVPHGMSMGASGTWHLELKHPDRFVVLGPYRGYVDTHESSETPLPNFVAVRLQPPPDQPQPAVVTGAEPSTDRQPWIGYTELRTDLPGGRHANVATMRAMVVRADGTGRRLVAEPLSLEPDTWTQFAGWSPDGRLAIVGRGWESPENARWEEEHKTFRYTAEGWLLDMNLLDLATGDALNVTAIERVSFHNSGLFFWPADATKLGFQAIIDGNSHPFRMDREGRNKRDLTANSHEFTYGFSASPGGRRVAYHKGYRVYVADADGSNAREIQTGRPFNFAPQWSADGTHLLFVAGEHYDCHPYVVAADGSGLRKLADRAGYRGVTEFLDVPDFHGGSSDIPAWSADGAAVYYTAKVGPSVELFRVALDGRTERLTKTSDGSLHYHPTPSRDGRWLLYGSKRDGVRQLYLMRLSDRTERRLTALARGHAAMWPHWQPRPGHSKSP